MTSTASGVAGARSQGLQDGIDLGRDDADELAWLIERDEERQRAYGAPGAALLSTPFRPS
jgi:hypothetical protein